MLDELKRSVLFTAVTLLLFGAGYHGLIWTVGRVVFPDQAGGSLIRRPDGSIAGSRLIAQKFAKPEYFHSRPSAVDYDAASTGGSNYGPSNPDHLKTVRERLDAFIEEEGAAASAVPSEMITASGGGLDPHIPPRAAALQAPRVARSRHVSVGRVLELIRAHTAAPALGIFGKPRVNVLELNLALDATFGGAPSAAGTASASAAHAQARESR